MTTLKFARTLVFLFITSLLLNSCTSAGKSGGEGDAGDIYAEELAEEELAIDDEGEGESAPAAQETAQAQTPADNLEDDLAGELEDSTTAAAAPTAAAEPVLAEPVPAEPILDPVDEQQTSEISLPSGDQVNITDIRYVARQGGTVVIQTSAPATYRTREMSERNQLIIEISNATLPERLKRPYVTKDFGQSIASVNAYQDPGSSTVRVVVQFSGPMGGNVSQKGSSITLVPEGLSDSDMMTASATNGGGDSFENSSDVPVNSGSSGGASDPRILPDSSIDTASYENTRFYGRPISIEVSDTPIREVINLIAEQSGANIVLSEDVNGNVSLKLRQVPWDQALLIVMKSRNLGYARQGSILRIAPYESLQRETESAQKVLEAQRASEPMRIKVIPVGYGKVEELSKQVEPFLTRDRGRVVADNRTNSLVVTDIPSVLDRVGNLIKALDTPPVQVLIEGKVIEARERFSREFGVRWGLQGQNVGVGSQRLQQNVSINANSISGPTFQHSLRFGTLDILGDLQSTLALAEKEDLVKVVSSPRVVALNNERASITQGTNIPIREAQTNDGVTTLTVSYQPIEMRLEVTPQVNSETDIVLDLTLKREFAGNQGEFSNQAPEINRREAKTKVLVKNGQTAVVGGVYQSDTNNLETGVPWVRNIPILGWLFKSRSMINDKTELLVFLTPRILNAEKALQKESSL